MYNNNTAGSKIFNIKLADALCTALIIRRFASTNKPVDRSKRVKNISVTFSRYNTKSLCFIFSNV
ncbi:MAG: hypothetical protein ACREV6_08045 [Clostridium sp.]|uniref:hypothetical protein n=1 Tax=Clostridium sp. TaxID=1506 RepID=UPI003D6D0BB0